MLKYEKEKEMRSFKAMNFKDKMSHIFTYYKLHISMIVIGIAVFLMAMNHYVWNPPKTPSLSIIGSSDKFVQTNVDEAYQAFLNDSLPNLNTDKTEIVYQGLLMTQEDNYAYYNGQKIMAEITAHDLDIIIGNEDLMMSFAMADYFNDLDPFLTEEEKASFELVQSLIVNDTDMYGNATSVSGPFNLLIKVPNHEIFQPIFPIKDEYLYIGIVCTTERQEACHEFLTFVRDSIGK